MAAVKAGLVQKKKEKGLNREAAKGKALSAMMAVYIRGKDDDGNLRAARVIEELYKAAMDGEDRMAQLKAIGMIFDRIDGKAVERKDIRNVKIEGIVYLPQVNMVQTEGEYGMAAE